jgi:hypothetical protein
MDGQAIKEEGGFRGHTVVVEDHRNTTHCRGDDGVIRKGDGF